jgi:hypothetical protein
MVGTRTRFAAYRALVGTELLDDDADYQTAYQSARTVAVGGGRG